MWTWREEVDSDLIIGTQHGTVLIKSERFELRMSPTKAEKFAKLLEDAAKKAREEE